MPLPARVCTIHIYQFGCRHKMSKIFIVPFDQPEDIDRVVRNIYATITIRISPVQVTAECHTTPRHIATPAHRGHGHILLRTVCEQRVAALMSFCYFTMTLTFESQRFSFPVKNEHIVDMLKGEPWRWVFSEWWYYVLVWPCVPAAAGPGGLSGVQTKVGGIQTTEYRGDAVFGNTGQTLLRSYITPWPLVLVTPMSGTIEWANILNMINCLEKTSPLLHCNRCPGVHNEVFLESSRSKYAR